MQYQVLVRNPADSPERLVLAYERLTRTFALFSGVSVLPYSTAADSRFRELRKEGVRIGTQDLRIASIALVNRGVLVTRNRRDFEKVSGVATGWVGNLCNQTVS